jgi:hypothetical protein
MTGNLHVVVGVELDCALISIKVRGAVRGANVRALFALMRRANSTMPGIDLVLDLTAAVIEPAALDQLRCCEAAHRLPAEIDPAQQEMALKVLPEAGRILEREALGLAA